MKKLWMTAALLLLCGLLCIPALAAPMLPTRSFYINDYASLMPDKYRNDLLALAEDLYADTGVQLVVLTVEGTYEISAEAFATASGEGWEIGGREQKGVLLFYYAELQQSAVWIGNGMSGIFSYEDAQPILDKLYAEQETSESLAVIEAYKEIAGSIYAACAVEPGEDTRALIDTNSSSSIPVSTWIVLVVALFGAMYSVRLMLRYRKKYMNRHQPQRRSHRRTAKTFDDNADGNQKAAYRTRREGFIVHRDPVEESEDLDND